MDLSKTRISYIDLVLDVDHQTVERQGQCRRLTQMECKLLLYLIGNVGKTVSRAILLRHGWGEMPPKGNVVDVIVRRIRSKVDDGQELKLIHTISGIGYVFGVMK